MYIEKDLRSVDMKNIVMSPLADIQLCLDIQPRLLDTLRLFQDFLSLGRNSSLEELKNILVRHLWRNPIAAWDSISIMKILSSNLLYLGILSSKFLDSESFTNIMQKLMFWNPRAAWNFCLSSWGQSCSSWRLSLYISGKLSSSKNVTNTLSSSCAGIIYSITRLYIQNVKVIFRHSLSKLDKYWSAKNFKNILKSTRGRMQQVWEILSLKSCKKSFAKYWDLGIFSH